MGRIHRSDVGCDDFGNAARNRERVRKGENTAAYQISEAVVKAWPRNKPLPLWIPQGDLPQIGKSREELQELSDFGYHIIENDYNKVVDNAKKNDTRC